MSTDNTKATQLAALQRELKSITNDTAKKAIEKKIQRLENDLESSGLSAKQLAEKLLKAKQKVKQLSVKDFNGLISRLKQKPEYAFLKSMTKNEIKDDLERPAKPVGWRYAGKKNYKTPTKKDIANRSASGVYYEARREKSDVSKIAQLENGGNIGDAELNKKRLRSYANIFAQRLGFELKGGPGVKFSGKYKNIITFDLQPESFSMDKVKKAAELFGFDVKEINAGSGVNIRKVIRVSKNLIKPSTQMETGGGVDKIDEGTLNAYFLLIREFDDADILEDASIEQLEKAKKMLEDKNWSEGEIFDWKQQDEADDYKREKEKKGFTVYETSGGDDIRFILYKNESKKPKMETVGGVGEYTISEDQVWDDYAHNSFKNLPLEAKKELSKTLNVSFGYLGSSNFSDLDPQTQGVVYRWMKSNNYITENKMATGGAVKGAKFKHDGKDFEIKKVQEGVIHTTNGKQYSLKTLESFGVKFNKEREKSNKPRGIRGERRKKMEYELEDLYIDLRYAKQDLRDIKRDMEEEAGQKGDNWRDEDANRYGGQMNFIEEQIESLNKKINEYEEKLSYAKGGNIDNENTQTVLNNNTQIAHHTQELKNAVKGKNVPGWVVSKVTRAASDLSDATHYLEGQNKMATGGEVSFSSVAVEKANLEQLFSMADEIGLSNYHNLNKEILRKKILEHFKLNRFRGKMATGGEVGDYKIGDILKFKDGEDWKVVRVKSNLNKLVIKPYNDKAKNQNVSLEIDIDLDYLKDNLINKMATGGEVGDTIRIAKDMPYMTSLNNLYNKDLKVVDVKDVFFASGNQKYYIVELDGEQYEVPGRFTENKMAKGGAVENKAIDEAYDQWRLGGGKNEEDFKIWLTTNSVGKNYLAKIISENNKTKMATGGGVRNSMHEALIKNYSNNIKFEEAQLVGLAKDSLEYKRRTNNIKEYQKEIEKLYRKLKMATGGGIGNAFSSVYNKAKNMSAKKIHDTKKDIALDVIDSTKDKVTGNKYKMTLKGAEQIIEDKYAEGGGVEDSYNIKNIKIGDRIKDKYNNEAEVWYNDGEKIEAQYISGASYVYRQKDFDNGEVTFLWGNRNIMKKGGGVGDLKQTLIKTYDDQGKDAYVNKVNEVLKAIKETRYVLNEVFVGEKVTYKNANGIPFKGEVIEIDNDGKYVKVRNTIGNIDYIETNKLNKI